MFCFLECRQIGVISRIRDATKAMDGISPQAQLFAALRGIAQSFSIESILGTCAENNLSYSEDRAQLFLQRYDEFFRSNGATGPVEGFYFFDNSLPEGPPSAGKGGHRSRADEDRKIKNQIAHLVAKNCTEMLATPEHFAETDNIVILRRYCGFGDSCRFFFTQESLEYHILRKGLVDIDSYLSINNDVVASGVDPVRHYLKHGAQEGRNPRPDFDTKQYVSDNPNVVKFGINPLVHFYILGTRPPI